MNTDIKKVLERVASWPQEVALEIGARRTGTYHLSDDERATMRKGMAAASRGEFVPDDEMEEFYQRHRKA